jgi:release factor H-coupled RctB family protein
MDTPDTPRAQVRVIASDKSWIEGEALRQLEHTAALPGMELVVGLPDLHPGKGNPIGAASFAQGWLYPYLVGGDIGCGMSLWRTDLSRRKAKRDRWAQRLRGLEEPWDGDARQWLDERAVALPDDLPAAPDLDLYGALGTIGGGNHFAELQQIEAIHDAGAAAALGLDPEALVVMVHSGSRGLGQAILRHHVDQHRDGGLAEGSDEAAQYLRWHDAAARWARANRALIAHRMMEGLGADGERLLDSHHNTVARASLGGREGWLHRKGAAPADEGLQVIPGSRGALSYVVAPLHDGDLSARSLAHGAGRKWSRGESRARLQHLRREALVQTELGGVVICEDKALLYEEAPQAYKDITRVIADLVEAGLVRVVATLRPLITYKTRR